MSETVRRSSGAAWQSSGTARWSTGWVWQSSGTVRWSNGMAQRSSRMGATRTRTRTEDKDTDKDRGQGHGTRTEDKDRGQGRGDSAGKDTDKDRGQGRSDSVNKLLRTDLWRAAALAIYRNLASAHTRNTHEPTPTRANTNTSNHQHEQTPTRANPHSLILALLFPHLGTSCFLIPALRSAVFRHFVAPHSLASVTSGCGPAS